MDDRVWEMKQLELSAVVVGFENTITTPHTLHSLILPLYTLFSNSIHSVIGGRGVVYNNLYLTVNYT